MSGLPIQTPSLRLRHFAPDDSASILALNAEPSTSHWLPSHVYANLAAADEALQFLIACYSDPGHPQLGPYVLAVEHADSRQLLGHVGFSPFDEDVEVSYAIAESSRGRGFGTEALDHACEWIAQVFKLPSVIALTATANLPSRRVLERARFAHVRDEAMRFQGVHQVVSRYCRPLAGVSYNRPSAFASHKP